jgi:hypothetical protein
MATFNGGRRWGDEVDVVVLGSGPAGCVPAIEAYDTDPLAEVMIVEKMPERSAGGNGRASGQRPFCPSPEDLHNLLVYQRVLNEPNPSRRDVLRTWAEGMVSLDLWVERHEPDRHAAVLRGGDRAGIISTTGGGVRNTKSQVLNHRAKAIPACPRQGSSAPSTPTSTKAPPRNRSAWCSVASRAETRWSSQQQACGRHASDVGQH